MKSLTLLFLMSLPLISYPQSFKRVYKGKAKVTTLSPILSDSGDDHLLYEGLFDGTTLSGAIEEIKGIHFEEEKRKIKSVSLKFQSGETSNVISGVLKMELAVDNSNTAFENFLMKYDCKELIRSELVCSDSYDFGSSFKVKFVENSVYQIHIQSHHDSKIFVINENDEHLLIQENYENSFLGNNFRFPHFFILKPALYKLEKRD